MQTITATHGNSDVRSFASTLAGRSLVVVGATAFVAVCAHIALPLGFTPVPLTLQTFAVLLIGLALGPQTAFAALSLYLAEGAVGLPVFNPQGLSSGAQLLGPTGGYLLAYPFAAAAAGLAYAQLRRRLSPFAAALSAAVPALLIIFAMGALWLGFLTHASAAALWATAVAPFLPGELLKMSAAAGCAVSWNRWKTR